MKLLPLLFTLAAFSSAGGQSPTPIPTPKSLTKEEIVERFKARIAAKQQADSDAAQAVTKAKDDAQKKMFEDVVAEVNRRKAAHGLPTPTPTPAEDPNHWVPQGTALDKKPRSLQRQPGYSDNESLLPDRSSPPIMLEVHSTATGYKQTSQWETDWGSYIRDYAGSAGAVCRVTSLSHEPVEVKLVWKFGGGNATFNGQNVVKLDKLGWKEVSIGAEGTVHIENYEMLGVYNRNGARPIGWSVQAFVGDKLIATKTSK